MIKKSWGNESGEVSGIEGYQSLVESILADVKAKCEDNGEVVPTIACFNGLTSFTIAGSGKAIDIVALTLINTPNTLE